MYTESWETKGEEEIFISYMADITRRELGGERVEKKSLVFAGEFMGSVNLNVPLATKQPHRTTYQSL
ncbi:hypothetical protein Bca52824_023493 [Brassica carinata]|uniref:Uncharacterized protein n=1 Tax=Brassica carinata TaxID=52824 RepID=A0A8X7VIJ9_BRACI|nr:hypothetical protein Bca52824_023493 [Brassica carinata]